MPCVRRILLALATVVPLAGCLRPANPAMEATGSGDYLFCFWNVENLFDDKLDGWNDKPDKEFDAWFSEYPKVLREKLDHLSDVLIELNGGRGPDILGIAECE